MHDCTMTTTTKSLNVVLCWHMHQPYYREGLKGAYHLPWVYLHGIKDYSDMAAHLERYPAMRAVVNFAPVLLEQGGDNAANDGNSLVPLHGQIAGEQFRQRQAASHRGFFLRADR